MFKESTTLNIDLFYFHKEAYETLVVITFSTPSKGTYNVCLSRWGFTHGFSFMDKQLLLTAVRFAQCRLVPYIANTVLYWQHFSRLVSAVPGCSAEHGFTYLDLHWIQLFRIIRNFLKLLETHQSQPSLEVWIFCDYPVTLFELLIVSTSKRTAILNRFV